MAISIAWNNASPGDTDDPRDGASDIRTFKQGIQERLKAGNIFIEDPSGTDTNAGKQVTGESSANKWSVYDGATKLVPQLELDDNASTLTVGDGKAGTVPYEVIADKISAKRSDFDKSFVREYATSSGTSAVASASATWPAAPQTLQVSDETSPVVVVTGDFYFQVPSTAVAQYLKYCRLEIERNGSGTWFNIGDLRSLGQLAVIFSDGTNCHLFATLGAMLDTTWPAASPIAAGDAIKFRLFYEADSANTGIVYLYDSRIHAHELVR